MWKSVSPLYRDRGCILRSGAKRRRHVTVRWWCAKTFRTSAPTYALFRLGSCAAAKIMSADDAVPLVTGIGPGGLLLGQGSPREIVVHKSRDKVGLALWHELPERAVIHMVHPGTAAEDAGLGAFDEVLSVEEVPCESAKHAVAMIREAPMGELKLRIIDRPARLVHAAVLMQKHFLAALCWQEHLVRVQLHKPDAASRLGIAFRSDVTPAVVSSLNREGGAFGAIGEGYQIWSIEGEPIETAEECARRLRELSGTIYMLATPARWVDLEGLRTEAAQRRAAEAMQAEALRAAAQAKAEMEEYEGEEEEYEGEGGDDDEDDDDDDEDRPPAYEYEANYDSGGGGMGHLSEEIPGRPAPVSVRGQRAPPQLNSYSSTPEGTPVKGGTPSPQGKQQGRQLQARPARPPLQVTSRMQPKAPSASSASSLLPPPKKAETLQRKPRSWGEWLTQRRAVTMPEDRTPAAAASPMHDERI